MRPKAALRATAGTAAPAPAAASTTHRGGCADKKSVERAKMITRPGAIKQTPPMSAPSRPRTLQAQKMARWVEGGTRQEVGRGDGVLELVGAQPTSVIDAELAKERDMGRWTTEADDTYPAPLAHDGRERHTLFDGLGHDRLAVALQR
jgi:hypothetical protein